MEGAQDEVGRGRVVQHEEIAVVHHLRHECGDGLLLLDVELFAHLEGRCVAVVGERRAAVALDGETELLERREVAADRLLGDLKALGKRPDEHAFVAAQRLHDLISAFRSQHLASPS